MAGTRSSSRTIADRYVSAIFDFAAGNDKTVGAFDVFFTALESTLSENKGIQRVIANPTVSRTEKAATMEALASALKAGKEQKNFLMLLAQNNRLDVLPAIITVFRERLSAERGELVLEITTAHAASKTALDSIKGAVEKETGRTAILKTREDAAILGGVVIKLGSTLLDYSVEGKLKRLHQSLNAHIANA